MPRPARGSKKDGEKTVGGNGGGIRRERTGGKVLSRGKPRWVFGHLDDLIICILRV